MRAYHIDDPNAKIFYQLKDEDGPSSDARYFQINRDTGKFTTKRYIDRPIGSIYEVTVIAQTLDDIVSVNLTIRVTVYNKCPPVFVQRNYTIEVGLDTKVDTELAVVRAVDQDQEPYNAEVYYLVQARNSIININRTSGVVTLRENLPLIYRNVAISILAYDGGSPYRTATTQLIITIKLISVPQNVVVEQTGDQWAMLCWQPPASGVPLGYIISLTTDFVSTTSTTRNITHNELGHRKGKLCTALVDLESWSNFEARVAGWNAEETGMMSPAVKFNTKVNRTCYNLNNSEFKCSCLAGFYGTSCSLFNPCARSVSPCLNGGKCSSNASNHYECSCPIGYHGEKCEHYNPCIIAKCQHGSTCYNLTGTKYGCKCLSGYTGALCETDIDECADNPCLNGGSCSDEIGKFICTCKSGFKGERCEININECVSNPCRNGGSCIDGEGSFVCKCLDGYTGKFCETDIDECLSNPCENNGTCVNKVASYTCLCSRGYEGDYCEKEIDECIYQPCFNGGTCKDGSHNDYKCLCSPGYTGKRCEIDIDLCLAHPCKNGATCIDNINYVACQCTRGYKGEFCQSKEQCLSETVLTSRGTFAWPNLEFGYTAIIECPFGQTRNESLLEMISPNSHETSIWEKIGTDIWKADTLQNDNEYLSSTGKRKDNRRMILEKTLQLSPSQKGRAFAVRSCILLVNGSAAWASMQDILCREEGFNAAEELSQNLENLTKIPSHINQDMFLQATNQIHQIMNYAVKDRKIAQTMISVLSNMLDVNGTILDQADKNGSISRGLINAVDTFTKEVYLPPHSNLSLASPNIALQVISLRKTDTALYENGIVYRPNYHGNSTTIKKSSLSKESISSVNWPLDKNDLNIIVPREAVLKAARGNNDIRIQFISFNNMKLFRSNMVNKSSYIETGGQVLSASIKNTTIVNLSEPLLYSVPNVYGHQRQICVFWDVESSEWLVNGIITNQTDGWIHCQSTHLTAFSVLLDPSPDGNQFKSPYAQHEAALSTISLIGSSLSIIGLLFTVLTYAIFRCLNRDKSGKILLNLCFSLLLMNISYLTLSLKEHIQNYFDQTDVCMYVALSTHYLVLTSLAWMLVEAINMYQLLITVFPTSKSRFMMKRMLFAWGVPFCIVSGTVAYTGFNYYKSSDPDVCLFSPQNRNLYYISFIAPACVILFINFIVFLKVSRVLCQRRSIGRHNTKSEGGITVAQVRGAFAVMTLLGITWIAGVFAVGKFRLVFQYFFCITNPLQGFIICCFRCILYSEARIAWRTLLQTGSCKKYRGPTRVGGEPLSHTTTSSQPSRHTDMMEHSWGAVRLSSHQAEIVRCPANSLTLPRTAAPSGPTPLICRSRSLHLSDDGCTSSKEGEDTSWRFVVPLAPQDQGYETAENSPESPRQKPHQAARLTVSTPERLHGSPPQISIIARSDGEILPPEQGHNVYPPHWDNNTSTSSSTTVSSPTPSPPLTTPSVSPTPSYDNQGWSQMPLVGISSHKIPRRVHCEELL
ncbi:uncharacterized protein LOC142323283 isoform X2 [Lycorma delicatula]|uniref:uncharacterized protein LOC142323283 isoform X2 n=1 Tax=Lycorma delicatula TaxID=130591 RepID=UPI003F512072